LLPRNKLAHASWNYLINDDSNNKATLTYNMNILQGLNTQTTYCVTLNSANLVDESQTYARFNYAHPVYSDESVAAQAQWGKISGCDRVYYCGAYWSAGFHEDGVKSALMVCQQLGVKFVE
jgi:predicted NAD/FAD-binding protein